jgi:S-DNA-T family DNA segregation ATPase FtsK/SpoIIIE
VPPNSPPANLIGLVGGWLAFGLFAVIGLGAYLVPLWCLAYGLALVASGDRRTGWQALWCTTLLLMGAALFELHAEWWRPTCLRLNIMDPGGIFGRVLVQGIFVRLLSRVGTGILVWIAVVAALIMLIGRRGLVGAWSWVAEAVLSAVDRLKTFRDERQDRRGEIEREERLIEKKRRRLERAIARHEQVIEVPEPAAPPERPVRAQRPDPAPVSVPMEAPEPAPRPAPPRPVRPAPAAPAVRYDLPPIDLLVSPAKTGKRGIETDTGTTSKVLIETLAEFGIEADVTNVERGPVVTRYEVLPAPGIRVERIAGLSNNLALSLKATSVRVQAPIPGKGVVGIEVPNSTANMVCLREMLEGDAWKSDRWKLPLVLGKDVGGNDLIADLANMPHLLVAGATGAGKTVCMNSMLAGLLMARTPAEMRLLLVDPKIVEFSVYNHLPHLVVPVVTNPKKVSLALRWAINEMEKRYKLFAKVGVRNIESYNSRVVARQPDLFGADAAGGEKEDRPPDRVPYIVIVIDELADLMLVDQAEIETSVARLAQLSRAVGIHMILSTQRPSVNVITGTIKANFPARIAFQVAQKVDSRTILDTVGADKLLGRGDMLYLPPGSSKLIRAQGAMTTDDEIRSIVEFVKRQAEPDYEVEIKDKIEKGGGAALLDDSEDEDVLNQAVEIIRETRRASTSSLQRRLRIGYTRAARVMDILEERGLVGPPRGSDPREILIDLDGEIPENPTGDEGDDEAGARMEP